MSAKALAINLGTIARQFIKSFPKRLTVVTVAGATIVNLSTNAASVSGVVRTGGTGERMPLAGVRVTLFEATTRAPTLLGEAVSDSSGHFVITSAKESSPSIFYLTAKVGARVKFVTVLGSELPAATVINELTTVAASYSAAQFYRTGEIAGDAFALRLAAGMNNNLVHSETGGSSPILLASPNADETNSLRSTRSLANLLAACVQHPNVTRALLRLTQPLRGRSPHDTAEALANLARDPGENVEAIYLLSRLANSYEPALVRIPDAWTVTVKVNDSGDDAILFGGPGNLAFDARGYAWVTNNVDQGTPYSSHYSMVLKPNGQPADGTDGTPVSPLNGGGLLGPGFGVAIDAQGSAWFGNFGWGNCDYCDPSPDGNGSISQFAPSGEPISPSDAYQGGPVRAQGMAFDADGNLWISSFGNDSVYVFLGGDPNRSVFFQQEVGSGPFDLAVAANGDVWVSNGLGVPPSSVARYALVNGQVKRRFRHLVGKGLRGMSLDSRGNAWIASQGDSSVYALRPDGTEIGHFSGGGIDGPWDTAVDGEDNIWVTNFGPLEPGSNFTSGRLTKLAGIRPPSGKKIGDPISPPTGYTVHSAGSEVLLHNGDPLYGEGAPPSFAPMMRQTGAVIDRAGNIWSINNWKPDFDIDATVNPGGDGIIIFVGLAPPRAH
jgi:sugar lactone lactonase YvrE